MASVQGLVQTTTQTNTAMDNDLLNPSVKNTNGRKVIFITLVMDGVDIDGDGIYDMVDAQFTNVTSEKVNPTRGCYVLNVSA